MKDVTAVLELYLLQYIFAGKQTGLFHYIYIKK